MKTERIVIIALLILMLCMIVAAIPTAFRPRDPGPSAVPLIGNMGSSSAQLYQREFDERLEKLNARMDAVNQSRLSWDAWHQALTWTAFVIGGVLAFMVSATGTHEPNVNGNNAASPPRTKAGWIMLILAWLGTMIQGADKLVESRRDEKQKIVHQLFEADSKAHAAFWQANTDKEYKASIELLREAERKSELGIK
jgi:hypothetical protein